MGFPPGFSSIRTTAGSQCAGSGPLSALKALLLKGRDGEEEERVLWKEEATRKALVLMGRIHLQTAACNALLGQALNASEPSGAISALSLLSRHPGGMCSRRQAPRAPVSSLPGALCRQWVKLMAGTGRPWGGEAGPAATALWGELEQPRKSIPVILLTLTTAAA